MQSSLRTSSLSDLNSALTELRTRETRFRNAAIIYPDPNLPAPAPGAPIPPPVTLLDAIHRGGQLAYIVYMEQARVVQQSFEAVTDQKVSPTDLEPEFVWTRTASPHPILQIAQVAYCSAACVLPSFWSKVLVFDGAAKITIDQHGGR